VPYIPEGPRAGRGGVLVDERYAHGFIDAIALALLEVKKARSLEELRERLEIIYGLAVEHKLEMLAQRLGYPLHEIRWRRGGKRRG